METSDPKNDLIVSTKFNGQIIRSPDNNLQLWHYAYPFFIQDQIVTRRYTLTLQNCYKYRIFQRLYWNFALPNTGSACPHGKSGPFLVHQDFGHVLVETYLVSEQASLNYSSYNLWAFLILSNERDHNALEWLRTASCRLYPTCSGIWNPNPATGLVSC